MEGIKKMAWLNLTKLLNEIRVKKCVRNSYLEDKILNIEVILKIIHTRYTHVYTMLLM